LNVAVAAATDDFDGNELDSLPGREECHQRFGFNLEPLRFERQGCPGFQMNEPETALCVG